MEGKENSIFKDDKKNKAKYEPKTPKACLLQSLQEGEQNVKYLKTIQKAQPYNYWGKLQRTKSLSSEVTYTLWEVYVVYGVPWEGVPPEEGGGS